MSEYNKVNIIVFSSYPMAEFIVINILEFCYLRHLGAAVGRSLRAETLVTPATEPATLRVVVDSVAQQHAIAVRVICHMTWNRQRDNN